jgi:hypothetical protein
MLPVMSQPKPRPRLLWTVFLYLLAVIVLIIGGVVMLLRPFREWMVKPWPWE